MKNGIYIYVDPSTLSLEVGNIWLPLTEEARAILLARPEVAAKLTLRLQDEPRTSAAAALCVKAATWDAVIARVDEILAAESEREKERAAAAEREAAALAERTVKWRDAAIRYLGGADLPFDRWGATFEGIPASAVDILPEERQAVEAEDDRRKAIKVEEEKRANAERRQAAEEQQQKIDDARKAWLMEHGYLEQAERHEAGVLPEDELRTLVRQHAPVIDTVPRYRKHTLADIEHRESCEEDVSASWSVGETGLPVCTPTMWASYKAIRDFYRDVPNAALKVREHEACLSCRCPDPKWYGVLVKIVYPEMDLDIQIEYALD
jgi:hypothetical protein